MPALAASAVADGLPDRNWVAFHRHWDWIGCENVWLPASLLPLTISPRPPTYAPSAPIRRPLDFPVPPDQTFAVRPVSSHNSFTPTSPTSSVIVVSPFPLHFPPP